MNFYSMIHDYCRRSQSRHTPDEIVLVASRNHIIANDNGFAVFAWVLDEFHILFAYAAQGKSFNIIRDEIEETARKNGIKRIKFSTDRPEAFGRLFRGYKPIATIMGRELT